MCFCRWHSSVPHCFCPPCPAPALQDGCVIRTAPAYLAGHAADTVIGREVTIGHQASLHGCTVGDRALVGMGATLLEGSVVRSCAAAGHCSLPAGWRACIALACPLLCLAFAALSCCSCRCAWHTLQRCRRPTCMFCCRRSVCRRWSRARWWLRGPWWRQARWSAAARSGAVSGRPAVI